MRHMLGGHRNKSCCWTTVSVMRKTGDDVSKSLMGPVPEAMQGGGGVMDQKETTRKAGLHHFLHSDVLIHNKLSCLDKTIPISKNAPQPAP